MTLRYKNLLITSCISLSLQAMEQFPTNFNNNLAIETNTQKPNPIDDLYKNTYHTLDYYNPKEIQTIVALSDIITRTKELKSNEIIQFAYQQEESIKNKVFSSSKPPYNNHFYVTVFFERIRAYNAHLQKNNFISPTLQQFKYYLENKDTKLAVTTAANVGIYIDKEKLLHPIASNIATKEFKKLLQNIADIQKIEPELMQKIAYRISLIKKYNEPL